MSKTGNDPKTDRELLESIYYIIEAQSNRLAIVEKKIINGEKDRRVYRRKREEKEGETLNKIKAVIRDQQFDLYTWIKDKVAYIGITLLIVWLSTFVK